MGGSESDGDEGFLQGDGKEMQASFKRKYMYNSKREGILSRSEKVYFLKSIVLSKSLGGEKVVSEYIYTRPPTH